MKILIVILSMVILIAIDFAAASTFYYFINGDMSVANQLKFYVAHCLSANLIFLVALLNKNVQKAIFSGSVIMLEKLKDSIEE